MTPRGVEERRIRVGRTANIRTFRARSRAETSLFRFPEGLGHPRLRLVWSAPTGTGAIEIRLASDRRLEFNEGGIFRHHPELDSE